MSNLRDHRKRKMTAHQKQMVFFTVFFGGIAVAGFVVVLWFLNHPHIAHN